MTCFVSKPSRITLVVLSIINTSYPKYQSCGCISLERHLSSLPSVDPESTEHWEPLPLVLNNQVLEPQLPLTLLATNRKPPNDVIFGWPYRSISIPPPKFVSYAASLIKFFSVLIGKGSQSSWALLISLIWLCGFSYGIVLLNAI